MVDRRPAKALRHTISQPTGRQQRAGIVNFSLDGWQQPALFARLKQQQVICAQRGAGIRLSPHFYTQTASNRETLQLLQQLATG